MNPSFTLIAANEIIGTVLLVGLVTNGAEVALLVALIALGTKPLFAAHGILTLPIPFCVAVLCHGFQHFLATQASDAVVAEPILLWHLLQRWRQAMDMHRNIAHFTDDDLVFVI